MYYYMGKSLGPPPTELELIHSLSYLSCCWPAATTLYWYCIIALIRHAVWDSQAIARRGV